MAEANQAQNSSARKTLTQERIRALLHYDPESGVWLWRLHRGKGCAGKPAGTVTTEGYLMIIVDGIRTHASRLAFLYMEGELPPRDADHINRVRSDDRWENLRRATRSQNNVNAPANRRSGTGARGVHFHKGAKRYRAQITKNRKMTSLGYFDTIAEASAAYMRAAKKIYGDFAHG